jgi:LacI family transcriptional regulator
MSTMRDVAALAGVSAKTVSRVMNNDRYVSEDVRDRVRAAVAELNYVPNALARTFRSGRDSAIGIAVPDISDPFFSRTILAIEQAARSRGLAVFITALGADPRNEKEYVEALLVRQIVGLILAPTSDDQSYLKAWQDRTALMFIDRAPGNLVADSVAEEDFGGAYDAAKHLLAHGHTRIAFVGDSNRIPTTARRLEGYRAALEEAGIDAEPGLLHLDDSEDPAEVSDVIPSLYRDDAPTAIFSSNARTSIATLSQLHVLGRTDIAFISFGDFPMSAALVPAVTVIDQDPAALGALAAKQLFARVDNPARRTRRRPVLPVSLVRRASCVGGAPVDRSGSPICTLEP